MVSSTGRERVKTEHERYEDVKKDGLAIFGFFYLHLRGTGSSVLSPRRTKTLEPLVRYGCRILRGDETTAAILHVLLIRVDAF